MERVGYFKKIQQGFDIHPVVALLGPRQVGKTTLAQQFASYTRSQSLPVHFFDLENPIDWERLQNPMLALQGLRGLIVLDEIQRLQNIFPVLRVLADRQNANPPQEPKAQFLILGSASRDLIQQSSETLAGRIQYIDVNPFSLNETGLEQKDSLWLRGGFPKSFLASSNQSSLVWREDFVRTFLERDIPQLGIKIPSLHLRRFWMMVTHYHSQILNSSELAVSLSINDTTVNRYMDILTGTFMLRTLPAWFENIGKRQVKRPKIYFRDSGIFHSFLGLQDQQALEHHPKLGASWEGFVIEEIIRSFEARDEEVYFWNVHGQGEIDLMIFKNGKRIGFEIKYADAPKVSSFQKSAVELLQLDHLYVITPLDTEYPVSDKITVIGFSHFLRNKG